jgi:uncharacterized RmlC-like cupin family protein
MRTDSYPFSPRLSHTGPPAEAGIVTVRPDATTLTRQRVLNFQGISGMTAGATGISMNLVIIPPGFAARPHLHRGYETAIYVLEGRVETRYGSDLGQSVINGPGDFIFIPADLPHQPVNLSDTEPVLAVEARNVADDQVAVELYEPVPAV